MKTEKRWYALHTRLHWEKKVAEQLTHRKIENYCPFNRVEHLQNDYKKIVMEPLFASYVFIHASVTDHLSIQQTEGVISFMYWLNKPAVIQERDIDSIKKFMTECANVKLEKTGINGQDHVHIIAGPIISAAGKMTEEKSETKKIRLPSMGFAMIGNIEKNNVELVSGAPVFPIYISKAHNHTLN